MVRALIYLIIIILVLALLSAATISLAGKGFIFTAIERTYLSGHSTANINDHTVFKTKTIPTKNAKPWPLHPAYKKNALPEKLKVFLSEGNAAAFLIIKDGQLLSESYFKHYDDRSKTNSFSMAKTVTTLLTSIAIDEGIISSFEQPIVELLPEFADQPLAAEVQVKHLSAMNSGYEWDENYYNALSPTVALYYSKDVPKFLLNGQFSQAAGEHFYYSSASTQLLGTLLNRALARKNTDFSQYLSEKLWQPLQMNDDALWHTDAKGNELTYCCLNTNARNFAKLGQLMLNKGNWNGQQLVSETFIEAMTKPLGANYYGLSTWLSTDPEINYYWFSGHLGQYIIVVPEENVVIVKLGESRSNPNFRQEVIPVLVTQSLAIADQP